MAIYTVSLSYSHTVSLSYLYTVSLSYLYTISLSYSHFHKLPDLTIKVNNFDDFNKTKQSFMKLTMHIT